MNTILKDIFKALTIALIKYNYKNIINISYIILAIVSILSPITSFIGQAYYSIFFYNMQFFYIKKAENFQSFPP